MSVPRRRSRRREVIDEPSSEAIASRTTIDPAPASASKKTCNTKQSRKSRSKSVNRLSIFGPPPLLEGEDASAYARLHERFFNSVKPSDIIEEIWVHETADLTWEIIRYRLLATTSLNTRISDARDHELDSAVDEELEWIIDQNWDPSREEPEGHLEKMVWQADRAIERQKNPSGQTEPRSRDEWRETLVQDPAVVRKLEKVRARAASDLDINGLAAQAFIEKLQYVERINQMTALAEARRNSILREIDRRRAMFAKTLRAATSEIEDSEFNAMKPKRIARRRSANERERLTN
jgi:hypothetical protein